MFVCPDGALASATSALGPALELVVGKGTHTTSESAAGVSGGSAVRRSVEAVLVRHFKRVLPFDHIVPVRVFFGVSFACILLVMFVVFHLPHCLSHSALGYASQKNLGCFQIPLPTLLGLLGQWDRLRLEILHDASLRAFE